MKSRQLANVLLKLMGFSVCLYAIPSCVAGILTNLVRPESSDRGIEAVRLSSYAIGAAVQLVLGIAIIAMSKKISGWLFKEDGD